MLKVPDNEEQYWEGRVTCFGENIMGGVELLDSPYWIILPLRWN